jgi:peptidoglycan hydrolase CwlO-like protein
MENQQDKPNNFGTWKATVVVLALIVVSLGYSLWDAKQKGTANEVAINEKVRELASNQNKLDSISTQLDLKIKEVLELGGKVNDLVALKKELEKDKAKLKANSISVSALQSKIRKYESLLTEKDAFIAQLKEENQTLITANTELGTQVQTLNSTYTELQTQKAGLETEKATLTEKITTVSSENKALSDKVAIAAALKAENVKVYGITSKGKEKDKEKYRSGKVDKIKVAFTLPSNAITEKNEKDIYVRVLGPDGAIISDEATGSGVFNYNSEQVAYTTKQSVLYNNNNQLAEIVYARGQKYDSGKYNVELFAEGFKIGEGKFEVR